MNHLADMLRPVCSIQKQFGKRFYSGALGVKDSIANAAAKRRSTGLACCDEIDLAAGKIVGHHLQLQRFSAAVDSFKGDQLSAQ